MADRTYLELSEDGGSSHKFYEVVVDGPKLTVRYGRIGDAGQTQVKEYPSPDKAKADAAKKIAEKTKKGYAAAVQGERKKRSVTRREVVSQTPTKGVNLAPVLWKFAAGGGRAFGIFVDEARAWIGTEAGTIFSLDHDGIVLDQFRLPDGVKCIVADDQWLYAGCDDGKVYDLGGKTPRVAYSIADDVDIYWLDIDAGVLGVSDASGNIAVFNHEEETQWRKKGRGGSAWMIRCDAAGVYYGDSQGVAAYDWVDGRELWHQPTKGAVLFGWQERTTVFASTSSSKVHRFTKRGTDEKIYACDSSVYSCAAAEDGKYVFAGDCMSSIYCFAEDGTRLWKLATGCGSACSMQFYKDRLYIVTSDGTLAAIDASEAAIEAAKAGTLPEARAIKAPAPVAVSDPRAVEVATSTEGGVIVECYAQGSQTRVRVVSPGYHADWNVQFPRDLREAGAKFVVDQVRESARGGFYRTLGSIRRLA